MYKQEKDDNSQDDQQKNIYPIEEAMKNTPKKILQGIKQRY